ncbi:hypothetical protein [Niveibacterium sp. SC-1]|uniref:hypothetical protein n=1 Tax=Niveibacterium sp. SC-1 TaxID=3135646 RepID=UPI0031204DB1
MSLSPFDASIFKSCAMAGALAAVLVFTAPAQALDAATQTAVRQQFEQATAGKSGALEASLKQIDDLMKSEPGNPLLLAYRGSLTSLQARDTLLPWKKMRFVEDGVADLDRALSLLAKEHAVTPQGGVSVSDMVKLTAATTFVNLPDFVNRGGQGEKLILALKSEPGFDASPAPYRAAVHLAAATRAAAVKDKPHQVAELKAAAALDGVQAERARQQLAELGQ